MLAIRFRAFALSTMAVREIRAQPAVLPSLMRFKHSKSSDKEKAEEDHKKEAKDKEGAKGAKKDDKKEKEAPKDAKATKKDKDGKRR
eukprot:scaffold471_cov318-Ochromonas_danica.AAC.6